MADTNDLAPPPIVNGGAGSVSDGRVNAPDYRQVQQPAEGLEPWRLQSDGAEEHAQALENALKSFGNDVSSVSQDVIGKVRADQGRVAGAAAGMDPNFKPLTGLQAITNYGVGYNAAAAVSYKTQSQLSLEKSLTDIETDTQGDPLAFQTRAGAVAKAALDGMDPVFRPEMQNWATARIQAGLARASAQHADDVRNQALADYQSSQPDLITSALHTAAALPGPQGDAVIAQLKQDDKDKLDAMVKSRVITPEQAVSLHSKMVDNTVNAMSGQKVDISLQPILQTMRSNVEAADKLIVKDDPNLTPEENATRATEFEKERERYVQTQTRANVDALAAVHASLEGGSYGSGVEGQLRTLYRAGALSEEGLFSGLAQSLRNQKADIEDGTAMRMVDEALHGQGPALDPKDKDQQDAANKYFDRKVVVDGGASIGNPQYAMAAAEFFRQTHILPDSVQAKIRLGLMSGDPTQATQAAALAAKIQGVNPQADAFVSNPHLAAFASIINDNLKAGLPPKQAYSMAYAQTNATPENQNIRNANYDRDTKATNATNVQALQRALNARVPSWVGHGTAPPAPVDMQAQNESLVQQFYLQTGDIAKARDLAAQQLEKTWGVTKVNGTPEMTQYPIRDADVPVVRSDIASSAASAGYTGDPAQIHLTPNANTSASQGRIWSLTHTAPDGTQDVLLDKNNRPLQYHLPGGDAFAKIRDQRIAAALDEARKQRDFERSVAADKIAHEKELADYYLRTGDASAGAGGK